MTYQIRLTKTAHRGLNQLGLAASAAALEFIFGPLAQNPRRVGKELRSPLTGQWSARRGDYRIIYLISEDTITVTVVTVAHRRDAYRH